MNKLLFIKCLFITSLIISNVVTGKILHIFGFVIPGAALCYAFTFLCTDIISEIEGKKKAHELVLIGFLCSMFASGLIFLTQQLPPAPFALDKAEAYNTLLGINSRVVGASMCAYFISQWIDVSIFHAIKKKTKGKYKWIRNTFSTMGSQLIDTGIFITIAFYGTVPNIWGMIVGQYLLKVIIAILDTPVFYLLTKTTLKNETRNNETRNNETRNNETRNNQTNVNCHRRKSGT